MKDFKEKFLDFLKKNHPDMVDKKSKKKKKKSKKSGSLLDVPNNNDSDYYPSTSDISSITNSPRASSPRNIEEGNGHETLKG
mmetsp:Transcript_22648/g.19666  ORF Transcript_22648/g.19666 Transcript_22648/m.19666 type:complete len:82 (+) Transcript_22648:302-547(+)